MNENACYFDSLTFMQKQMVWQQLVTVNKLSHILLFSLLPLPIIDMLMDRLNFGMLLHVSSFIQLNCKELCTVYVTVRVK